MSESAGFQQCDRCENIAMPGVGVGAACEACMVGNFRPILARSPSEADSPNSLAEPLDALKQRNFVRVNDPRSPSGTGSAPRAHEFTPDLTSGTCRVCGVSSYSTEAIFACEGRSPEVEEAGEDNG